MSRPRATPRSDAANGAPPGSRTSATTRPRAPRRAQTLRAVADVEQRKTNEMIGAELGYRYRGSPLIASEPGEGPQSDFRRYVPTTWPGARLPHAWLDDGSAMQDRIGYGHGYTPPAPRPHAR